MGAVGLTGNGMHFTTENDSNSVGEAAKVPDLNFLIPPPPPKKKEQLVREVSDLVDIVARI